MPTSSSSVVTPIDSAVLKASMVFSGASPRAPRWPCRSKAVAGMPAVGVLALELAWTIDFLTGGRLIGLAGYMLDPKLPLYLRALSLFHLALPPTLVFLLYRLGYDRRALIYQTLLTWIILVVSYLASERAQNINWVFGPGSKPQPVLPPLLYLALEKAVLPL